MKLRFLLPAMMLALVAGALPGQASTSARHIVAGSDAKNFSIVAQSDETGGSGVVIGSNYNATLSCVTVVAGSYPLFHTLYASGGTNHLGRTYYFKISPTQLAGNTFNYEVSRVAGTGPCGVPDVVNPDDHIASGQGTFAFIP